MIRVSRPFMILAEAAVTFAWLIMNIPAQVLAKPKVVRKELQLAIGPDSRPGNTALTGQVFVVRALNQ